jgi:hypothetical protein
MNKSISNCTTIKARRWSADKGFTIVELVLSIVVGVIFVGLIQVSVGSYMHISQKGRDLSLANSYVEGKVESLRNLGYNSLGIGTTSLTSELPTELNSPKSGSLVVTDLGNGIKKAVVNISYSDQGASRSYSYTTYVGELGVGQ